MFLTILSTIAGLAGFYFAYVGNLTVLKLCTVVACLFCMCFKPFVSNGADHIGRKTMIILFAVLVTKVVSFFTGQSHPMLGWIIADAFFVLSAFDSIAYLSDPMND